MAGIRTSFKEKYYEEIALRADMAALTIRMDDWGNKLNPNFSYISELNAIRAEKYETYSEFCDAIPKFGDYVKASLALIRTNLYINHLMIKESRRLKKAGFKVKYQIVC